MSQTLLEMAKDLVMAQIEAQRLSPDDMHQALQQTYASLKALQAQEDGHGHIAVVTPGTPPAPVNWRKSITKHHVTCLECGASFNPTLTPARYMQGLTIDKIIACEIFASRVCM